MFDTTVELIGASVGAVNVEAGKEGVLELVFVSGLTLPVEGPDGNPLRIPNGQYRFQLTRSQAIEFFKKATDAAEELPEGSNLVVPSAEDVKNAEKMADQIKDLKNG
jgi:hypothetical protein